MRLAPALDMKEPFYPAVQFHRCVSNKMNAGAFLAAALTLGPAAVLGREQHRLGTGLGWRGWLEAGHTPCPLQGHSTGCLPCGWVKAPVCGSASPSSLRGRIPAGSSEPCISRQILALISECSQSFILVKFSF